MAESAPPPSNRVRRGVAWFVGGILAGALIFLWWGKREADAPPPPAGVDPLTELMLQERLRQAETDAELERLRKQLEAAEKMAPPKDAENQPPRPK